MDAFKVVLGFFMGGVRSLVCLMLGLFLTLTAWAVLMAVLSPDTFITDGTASETQFDTAFTVCFLLGLAVSDWFDKTIITRYLGFPRERNTQ